MTDKDLNQNKLPYIVLPSLSAKETKDSGKRNEPKSGSKAGSSRSNKSAVSSLVKQSESSKLPLVSPHRGKQAPSSPKDITSSKALSRHIALSKQFTGKGAKDIQETQKTILLAHYDMQQSPRRSMYANNSNVASNSVPKVKETTPEDPYGRPLELTQFLKEKDSQGQRRKALENLAQLFPHRVRKPKSTRASKPESSCSTFPSNSSSDENIKLVAAKLVELSTGKQQGSRNNQKADSRSEEHLSADQIQSKFDGLTVHIHNRDAEMSQLSQDLIDLQLLVLKEKKESEKSKNTILKLENEVRKLEGKLRSVECTVEGQEKKILEKLFLFDEMDTTDSDSDFGSTYCKPSNWTSTKTTCPPAKPPISNSNASAIGTLKECTNWIPVAPDFDKLINIISMMNIRMDRNQSMKLHKKGNTASFQHSDSINLTLYKNGLILGTTAFRSYTSLSVIKLINEIFQGYFPSELQSQYPEGVVFVIIDKRSFPFDMSENSFCGEGNMLKDSSSIPRLIPGNDFTSAVIHKSIASGSDTDNSIRELSSQSSLPSASPSTTLLNCLPALESESNDSLLLLKLKNSENGKTYKVQVSNSCSVNDLLQHLETHISDLKYDDDLLEEGSRTPLKRYELVMPVPYGILTSGTSSLKDYGIIQNTLLYFKHPP